MISHRECRERAGECRETAKRAPNASVQAILIDMARTWERLALQILQSGSHDERFSQSDQMAFPFTADFGGEGRILWETAAHDAHYFRVFFWNLCQAIVAPPPRRD